MNTATGTSHRIYWTKANEHSNQPPLYDLPLTVTAAERSPLSSLLLHRFKPYLNTTIPFLSPQTRQWEPKAIGSDGQEISLVVVQQTLAGLLSTLNPQAALPIACRAEGLTAEEAQTALGRVSGVVVNQPVGSSDAYRFNLREIILAAGLVLYPEQIFIVEEAIAALLPELHQPTDSESNHPTSNSGILPNSGILIVSAGTSATELTLAKTPSPDQASVDRSNLFLRRLAYAGNALDQDIICQLLSPTARNWESLRLDALDLPLPGEPDLAARYRLQQQFESVPLGQRVLSAVREAKPLLCQQDIAFTLDGQHWQLRQQDLQNWVLAPYLQQLSRELNTLLSSSQMTGDRVERVVCTGGTATIAAIIEWLKHKFPHATVISDAVPANSTASGRTRIAHGLALLPHFPNVLDRDRHQYSDYFFLRTLLKLLPVQADPFSITHLLNVLESAGIPARVCQPFIRNLLEGQLPIGLVATKASAVLLSPASVQNPEYEALATAPLFTRQGNGVYRIGRSQRDRLWNYLQIILANTEQTLEAPLSLNLIDSQAEIER